MLSLPLKNRHDQLNYLLSKNNLASHIFLSEEIVFVVGFISVIETFLSKYFFRIAFRHFGTLYYRDPPDFLRFMQENQTFESEQTLDQERISLSCSDLSLSRQSK